MRLTFTTLALLLVSPLVSVGSAHADFIVTGLGDPDGGTGDILELYATADIADLSTYGLERASNSGSLDGSADFTFASVALSAGDFYYVTTDQTDFTQFTGFGADEEWSSLSINGNDTVGLYENGTLVDRVLDDADNTDVHGDGWIYRNDSKGPNSTFDMTEWEAHKDVLGNSNDETNEGSELPMPLGTYSAVPEPSSFLLFGAVAGCGLFMRRRSRGNRSSTESALI